MKQFNRIKQIFIYILPVLLGVLLTVILSTMVYRQMILKETKDSWEQLDSVALSVAEKVTIRFEDNLNLLGRVADAITLKGTSEEYGDVLEYMKSVQDSTIFERIDILLPNDTIVHQNGVIHPIRENDIPYSGIIHKGGHYSGRDTDRETGRQVMYCATPIYTDGEAEGVLIGVVDCQRLEDIIKTYSFGGEVQIFLVDQNTGDYLMDNWQETLGNVHDEKPRQRLEGFEHVRFSQDMVDGTPGHIAFVSQVNGQASYMSYVPVSGFPWSLAVAAQEDRVLEGVQELVEVLNRIAVIEMVLLVSYVVWNLVISYTLVHQQENVQKIQLEAATNEAKSLFLSSVSHDIRTPLNGILGMLNVIDHRSDVPESLGNDLKKIRLSAEYLVSLANNMLDLNDLESGRGQMEEDHIDLYQLGPDLEVLIQSRIENSTVSFHLEKPVLEHPCVLGSDAYLHRILANLIGNAVKYSKENGSVWVSVEELEPQENRSLYRFTVRDDGIGMSEEFQEKLFHAFEQENAGARSRNQGHGLGLAIVDRMVRRMGGSITVESRKGEGSTFAVTLPFRWDTAGKQAEFSEPAKEEVSDLQGARILLAEDNALNMEIATLLLRDAGAQITQAFDGRQAVDVFAASEPHTFDVILMDLMMPEMDGCEATRAIRTLGRPDSKTVPIIAMTASTFAEDVKRCRDAGMNDHIGKPLDMENLFQLVDRYRKAYRDKLRSR